MYQRSSPTTGRTLNVTTRYRQQTGLEPTVAAAVRFTGPNRARVRDYLTSGATYSGLGGAVSFDKAAILKANTFYKSPPILPFGQRVSREPPPCAASANSPRSRRAPPRDAQTLY
jgi:hypothetical protein